MANVIATYIQKGETIDYENTTGEQIEYNQVVPLANCIGIAGEVIPDKAVGSLYLNGAWELPAATSLEIKPGDAVYWSTSDNNINKTELSNIPAGIAISHKEESGTSVVVKIG